MFRHMDVPDEGEMGESPELAVDESPEVAKSSGESDTEGDAFYHPSSSHHMDVDPK